MTVQSFMYFGLMFLEQIVQHPLRIICIAPSEYVGHRSLFYLRDEGTSLAHIKSSCL